LQHLDAWISARTEGARADQACLHPLQEAGLVALPSLVVGHSWQTFMVVLSPTRDRAAVISGLKDRGIEANLGAQSLSTIG
ncbi:hypothetical protein, partial [Acinetobacter baumannii]|uniref:hypothetical protein n=1 Tax=Acinetobacter baumannii TaxID=470 RepID=UPI001BB46840